MEGGRKRKKRRRGKREIKYKRKTDRKSWILVSFVSLFVKKLLSQS